MLPKVIISLDNEALGQSAQTADGVVGFILSGVAIVDKIALYEPKQVFSLKAIEDLGITADYDTTNQTDAYSQIKSFFDIAGTGAELWFMLAAKTDTMTTIMDKSNTDGAVKLLNAAGGRIKILGITRTPDVAYTPTSTGGLDADVATTIINAQTLAAEQASAMKPIRVIIAGRDFSGIAADLTDLKTMTNNRVAILLHSTGEGSNEAAVGLLLGKIASIPVQRNIGRVKDGALPLENAYLTDGNDVAMHTDIIEAIHDKGYILVRNYQGKAGFFYTDDPTATALTDDYNTIARGRVIDKAIALTYLTYIEELNDELLLSDNGQIQKAALKELQSKIESVINLQMTSNEQISAVVCEIDANQNVLATNSIAIKIRIVPVGYKKQIDIELGFATSV